MWKNYLSEFYRSVKKRFKRRSFGRDKTMLIWEREFGERYSGKCPVCKEETITPRTFERGYIISLYNGGSDEIRNIRPICKLCNRKMGATNWSVYVKRLTPARNQKRYSWWDDFFSSIFGPPSHQRSRKKREDDYSDDDYLGDPYSFMGDVKSTRSRFHRHDERSNYTGWMKSKFK